MSKYWLFIPIFVGISCASFSQNIGVGTTSPAAKLHVKGAANITQLIIDANSTQSNSNPLIRLRNSAGSDLAWLHSDHASNIFLGVNAGTVNNATGGATNNTFIGNNAGTSNATGFNNTANGSGALFLNSSGSNNAAYGYMALYSNYDGYFNTAVGNNSLQSNDDGANNTAVGYTALKHNVDGGGNTAIGATALFTNTAGYNNTANGFTALYLNSTGSNNTATGVSSLYGNTNGRSNTADGAFSLSANTTGNFNTAIGFTALNVNTTGSSNTALGYSALYSTTTSLYNTAIGYNAAVGFNMGYNNTILGANCDVNQAGVFNAVGIGQAVTNTASSQARIGNAATNSIGGYANWTNISDGRFKKDIAENVKGIDFIMKLRPVTYHLDVSGLSKTLDEARGKELDKFSKQAIVEKEQVLFSGFVAQEVEIAAKQTGYDFSGVDKPKNDKDLYGLRYAEFVVPLVKAVQEQQQLITGMQKRIALLEEQNKMLAALLAKKN